MKRAYRIGDRVHRVRGHPLADYRPTGARGTVVGVSPGEPYQLVRVRWDGPHKSRPPVTYHPDVLEPLSAIDQLGELGRTTPGGGT